MLDIILTYFPDLDKNKIRQFENLYRLYEDWNTKINVISRKDFEFFYLKHVLHSLALAKYRPFETGEKIIDVGSGGGFPGVPLAIMFPETQFTLLDSIRKKMTVASGVIESLELQNVTTQVDRSENIQSKYDIIISRAVTQLPKFLSLTHHLIDWNRDDSMILYLKGGDFQEELNALRYKYNVISISKFFDEEFFSTKKIVKIYR